jgi:hypothetical protein
VQTASGTQLAPIAGIAGEMKPWELVRDEALLLGTFLKRNQRFAASSSRLVIIIVTERKQWKIRCRLAMTRSNDLPVIWLLFAERRARIGPRSFRIETKVG